jgi:hypothetical protein
MNIVSNPALSAAVAADRLRAYRATADRSRLRRSAKRRRSLPGPMAAIAPDETLARRPVRPLQAGPCAMG